MYGRTVWPCPWSILIAARRSASMPRGYHARSCPPAKIGPPRMPVSLAGIKEGGGSRNLALGANSSARSAIVAFGSAVMRYESGSPDRCPKCGSYSVAVGYNPEATRHYTSACEKCDWQSHDTESTPH